MRVELAGIRKRYGKLEALAGVGLELAAGTRVALIGPNGSGKTTLTRVILGLVSHEGRVLLDGRSPAQAAREVAYVPQIAPQMAATVRELVRVVCALRDLDGRTVVTLAAELGLDVAAVATRPFRGLSGGMKQKLLLALALASAPRLIILDEPTASLDAAARARFAELQRERLGDATVILCSHRLDELRVMVDRVVVLEDGHLTHDGDAAAYVSEHTESVIELRVASERAWLRERGFAVTAAGWWTRRAAHADKMRLLPEAMAALGADLLDVVVRDGDRVAP